MQVIGNIGTPVEKSISKNGREYFKFRLAENHNSKPKTDAAAEGGAAAPAPSDQPKVDATWYYVNAFIPEEVADMLGKGAFVSVTGRLEASPYMNKENQPAVRLTIMAGKVEPIERKKPEQK
jgi:single-stranded DNA-binding protein